MVKRRAPGPAEEPDAKQLKTVPETIGTQRNREKVLILSSRGITYRYRHLMLDMLQLLPHSKKDSKLDTKADRGIINEVAEMKGCGNVMFFEARKKKDLYVWLAKTPSGPSVKFHVANVHTMAELKLSGNHLKGSRPVLSFDQAFDEEPHLQLLKEMFTHTFATPKRHQRSKPFSDHVLSFTCVDGRVWLRNYQVTLANTQRKPSAEGMSLVEVGPRCCMDPIKMFAGSFGGPVLYDNPAYVSPNRIRAMLKQKKMARYGSKVQSRSQRRTHVAENPLPQDEFANVFKAAAINAL
ncbi:hypothetical protein WJX74_010165 [Apatococcus lobatus]|uniref:Brix domain-containing protein n=1 Tax=Apatococcus lobatus TaxID=904363 RepID=A0AAW1S7T6_9CHLO